MTHKPEQFTENEGLQQHGASPRSELVCHMHGLNSVQYTLHQIFFSLSFLAVWQIPLSLSSTYWLDPNCDVNFFWLISLHRLKQNNSATVYSSLAAMLMFIKHFLQRGYQNMPSLLSRTQQYLRWELIYEKYCISTKLLFCHQWTWGEKKLLNSGKNVPFSFGTANFFHFTVKTETDLLIKVWSLLVIRWLQKPPGTIQYGCFPGFSFPLITSRETYVNITEQVLISNWEANFNYPNGILK